MSSRVHVKYAGKVYLGMSLDMKNRLLQKINLFICWNIYVQIAPSTIKSQYVYP